MWLTPFSLWNIEFLLPHGSPDTTGLPPDIHLQTIEPFQGDPDKSQYQIATVPPHPQILALIFLTHW